MQKASVPARDLRSELKATTRLGLPLALGELGWMSTYLVDARMVGQLPHSALAISASSLGNTIFYAIAFCAIYLLNGMQTVTAQSFGRGDQDDSFFSLAQSVWFVALGTPAVMLLTLGAIPLLRLCGISDEIVGETSRYLHALIWSAAPLLLYMALRRYLQSMNRVILIAISLITANGVNFLGDYAFLFGHFGAARMGIAGSAWATVIVRFYMLGLLATGLLIYLRREQIAVRVTHFVPDRARLGLLAGIGWPSALQSITDFGFSTYMSILCARLGTTLLAAHQVVLDLDAFIYMVPFGLSFATNIRVAQGAGRESMPEVRRSARASLILGCTYISIASALFAGLPRLWGSLYTNDPAVVEAAAPIFMICGILQLGDAVSAILAGALYGLGDTRTSLIANTAVYWIIGMPLSYGLAFYTPLGLRGLWLGRMVAALGTAAYVAQAWYARVAPQRSGRRSKPLSVLRPMHTTLAFPNRTG